MKLMSEEVDKIAGALVQAQQKMENAIKDSKNPFFKSKYADINSVREAVLPALNDVGISVWQPTVFFEGRKFVKTLFMHTSGQYLAGLTEIVYAKEGDPQAQIAGTTYARRGGLQSMANIGAEDDDGNTAAARNVSSSPAAAAVVTSGSPALVGHETKAESAPARRSFRTPNATKGEEL
jgi:hypothetical protein